MKNGIVAYPIKTHLVHKELHPEITNYIKNKIDNLLIKLTKSYPEIDLKSESYLQLHDNTKRKRGKNINNPNSYYIRILNKYDKIIFTIRISEHDQKGVIFSDPNVKGILDINIDKQEDFEITINNDIKKLKEILEDNILGLYSSSRSIIMKLDSIVEMR